MTNVTTINARSGETVVEGALEKLAEYAATLGLAVTKEGRWQYDRNGKYLNVKFRFTVGGEQGKDDLAAEAFGRWAKYYEVEASDYGAILTIRGRKFKLVRINSRRGVRFPFECESVDGGPGIRLPQEYSTIIKSVRKA